MTARVHYEPLAGSGVTECGRWVQVRTRVKLFGWNFGRLLATTRDVDEVTCQDCLDRLERRKKSRPS